MSWLAWLFHEWMPHARCVENNPFVLGMQLPADLMIFLAYMVIGLGMLRDRQRFRQGISSGGGVGTLTLYAWFGAFIFWCGLTHLMKVITAWRGLYVIDGVVDVIAAVVSWGTIIVSVRAQRAGLVTWKRPDAAAAYDAMNRALAATLAGAKQVEKEVRRHQKRHGGAGADG